MTKIVGQTYFPLFLDKRTTMPCASEIKNPENLIPHIGFYQMPLYHVIAVEKQPFTYERFIYHNRVPGASVYLRVYRNKLTSEANPLWLVKPDYKSGVFSTKYYIADEVEQEALKIRRKRDNPKIILILKSLMESMGQDANIDDKSIE